MTTSTGLAFPEDIRPVRARMTRSRNESKGLSPYSRSRDVTRFGRPLWRVEMDFKPNCATWGRLLALLEAQNGAGGVWTVLAYPCPCARNTAHTSAAFVATLSGDPVTWDDGTTWDTDASWAAPAARDVVALLDGAIGARTLPVDGFAPSTLILYTGERVQIGRRMYVLDRDITSDFLGRAVLTLASPEGLIEAVAAGDPVETERPRFEAWLDVDAESYDRAGSSPRGGMTLTFMETD